MRKPTACTQCRRMKLACNGERPCQRCIARDRVALCTSQSSTTSSRERRHKSVSKENSSGRQPSSLLRKDLSLSSNDLLKQNDKTSRNVREHNSEGNVSPLHNVTCAQSTIVRDPETGEIMVIGQHSSMLYFQSLLPDSLQSSISVNTILSAFLLSNESTIHPFGTLWRPGWNLTDIFEALPESRICLMYFEAYREASRHYLPTCIDFVDFEQRMCFILQKRDEIGLDTAIDQSFSRGSVGRNAWCGLWFAVLAAGCQWSESLSSSSLSSEQDATIKVFVACSFECLRRAHLYACSSLEILQTLLLLEAVMCNAGNPGLSWNMLGLTWRQAYGVGLSMSDSPLGPLADLLWQSIVELDAAISYAYNRIPLAALTCKNRIHRSAHLDQIAKPLTGSEEAVRRLQYLRLEFQNEDWANLDAAAKIECLQTSLGKIETLISLMSDLPTASADEIKDVEFFKIMASQFKADLHRLSGFAENADAISQTRNYEEAKVHYHEVLLSFNRLVRFEKTGRLSWMIRQAVTSSALVLAVMDRASSDCSYKVIVQKTILTLEDTLNPTSEIEDDLAGDEIASRTPKHASVLIWALYENA